MFEDLFIISSQRYGSCFISMAERKTKRPSLSSTLKCTPDFIDSTNKRQKNNAHDVYIDDNEEGPNDDNEVTALWAATNELPPHLSGNKYFNGANETTILLRENIPVGFSLSQAICSYGYFCLAPNRWVPRKHSKEAEADDDDKGYLVRPLSYGNVDKVQNHCSKTALIAIGQNTNTKAVVVAVRSSIERVCHKELTKQIDRMLRLDTNLENFHELHMEAKERGFGRLYRSPTLFEDTVKTITNCNMKWGGTVEMNAKLCRHVGNYGAFPTPEEINRVGADFLKKHCRVGYRGAYISKLANNIVEGRLDMVRDLESMDCREDIQKRLIEIKGIGPFAANNILQLMGYFDTHPYDTETVRLWKEEFGAPKSSSKADVFEKARLHYARYEPYSFIAYWYDLWKNYEKRAGLMSPQWSIEQFEKERPSGVESDRNSVFVNPTMTSRTKSKSPKRKKMRVPVDPQ